MGVGGVLDDNECPVHCDPQQDEYSAELSLLEPRQTVLEVFQRLFAILKVTYIVTLITEAEVEFSDGPIDEFLELLIPLNNEFQLMAMKFSVPFQFIDLEWILNPVYEELLQFEVVLRKESFVEEQFWMVGIE